MDSSSPKPFTTTTINRVVTIRNIRGLHARAAAKFVKTVSKFESDISVRKADQTVSGRSIMGLMMLAAAINSEIFITANGNDAIEAMDAICVLIEDKFGEGE